MTWSIPEAYRPPGQTPGGGDKEPVSIRWLGTAAFEIRSGGETLLLDPFVSRPPVGSLLPWRRIKPDGNEIARCFPAADLILIGHSHYDHLMDAPAIASRCRATLAGSPTSCFIAEALGLPREQTLPQADPPRPFTHGAFRVRFVPSLHGKVFFGRVPMPGRLAAVPPQPRMTSDFPAGHVYGLWFETAGVSFYHLGSADLVDRELEHLSADVLLLGLAGRSNTPNFFERVLAPLAPKLIIPSHYDWFFSPLKKGLRLLPRIRLEELFEAVERYAPAARVVMPGLEETLFLSPKRPEAPWTAGPA